VKTILRTLALLLLATLPVIAQQSSTVTIGAITDSGGIAWNNGTWNLTFVGQPNSFWPGGALKTSFSGSLNSSGSASQSTVPTNITISPSPSFWNLTVCPNPVVSAGPSGCFQQQFTISLATQTINPTPPAILISVPTTPVALPPITAYADAEISGGFVNFTYYNLTLATTRICTALPCSSNWTNSGSVSPAALSGNQNAVYASPLCPSPYVSGNCYPVNANVQFAFDGTTNTAATSCGAATVTAGTCVSLTSTDAAFSCGTGAFPCSTGGDNGKSIFATTDPFSGNVLFTQGTLPTIVQVIDATHAQASAAATASVAGTAVVLWGSDDTANLQAADNARYYNRSYCGTLYLPQGAMFDNAMLFNLPSGKCLEFGAWTIGQGEDQTLIITVPTFPISTCNGLGTNICFLGAPGGTNGKTLARDWTLWGGGNNRTGQNDGTTILASPTFSEGFEIIGWAEADTGNVTGLSLQVQGGYMLNASASDGAGRIGCAVVANGVRIAGSFCGDNVGTSLAVSGSSTTLLSEGNIFGPCCNGGAGTDVQVASGAVMTSFGDVTVNPGNGSSDDYTVGGAGSVLNLISVTATANSAGDVPVFVLSGGTLSAFKMILNPPASGVGLNVASGGFYYDDCGENTITNSGTFSVAGTVFGDCSITGAAAVIANFAVTQSGGFGTTAAVTAVTGAARATQFTITNSGTTQGASPTVTFTFPTGSPTGFPVPPVCQAILVGGNDPTYAAGTGRFATSSTSKTNAVFTFNGTPTVNDTEIVQISCHVQ
jgi:hypothetical protein